jgi:Domain of unknown function (DUF4082)/Putative Ig domain/Bacterial Ig domain
LFNAEYPMIRWLEANGYNVSYTSGIETDRSGARLLQHRVFVSVGHDEYWSATQRANVEAARNAGVNLAFLSGNEVFWKTRWESSIAGTTTAYRTLVCYKETHAGAEIDPSPQWTGTWRDSRFSPPSDGGRPENALTGTLFTVNGYPPRDSIKVPAEYGLHRFWRNSGVNNLAGGTTATLLAGTLGYEWDECPDNGFRPAGAMLLSSTTISGVETLRDYGSTYVAGSATHSLCLYRHNSGAWVFGAGTIDWSWGLDANHDNSISTSTSQPMKQAMVNLFADMSVQPASLQPGLVAATLSPDRAPPVSTISSPSSGASIKIGTPMVVTGLASDASSRVWAVEVSSDGGATWSQATGRGSWSYLWTPKQSGLVTLKSRAVDDNGNLEIAGAGVSVTVVSNGGSVWSSLSTPAVADVGPDNPVELGMKFRSDVAGSVQAIRFYKSIANTGTHAGSLWSATGTRLATVIFSGESASGWQQMNLSAPINITANTVYIVSYHTAVGHYCEDVGYFSTSGVNNGPLHALVNGESGGDGVFAYGTNSAFPNQTWSSANYWVDLVFLPASTVVPSVAIVTASLPSGVVSLSYSAMLAASGGVSPYSWALESGLLPPGLSLNAVSGVISGTPTSIGVFNFTLSVQDSSSPVQSASRSFAITITAASPNLTIWPSTIVPSVIDPGPDSSVELGVRFVSDVPGKVLGIRFYKSSANTGSHTGTLWSSAGTRLASATFASESVSGWQQVNFTTPVSIQANTVYVASYHTSTGHYSYDLNYFTGKGADTSPLHAPANGTSAPNGCYAYGVNSLFPNASWNGSNYWVDIVFQSNP